MNFHVKAYKNDRMVCEQIMLQPKTRRTAVIKFLTLWNGLEFDYVTVGETDKQ
jgi:hypothetical protein